MENQKDPTETTREQMNEYLFYMRLRPTIPKETHRIEDHPEWYEKYPHLFQRPEAKVEVKESSTEEISETSRAPNKPVLRASSKSISRATSTRSVSKSPPPKVVEVKSSVAINNSSNSSRILRKPTKRYNLRPRNK
ncbi:unnamed protein product [Hymenolepis diminuta]|uniref:Uncharacterized protein n=1 Tax=Hymenolepis diminuta TaxID=6216 RepID=A0A564YRQ2_HYMDI|nr:unnamed protein product [Hymenolepis diminuta]